MTVSEKAVFLYRNKAETGRIYAYENRDHFYLVKVHGFGDYSFDLKVSIEGNEAAINSIRRSVKQWKWKD